MYKKKDIKLCPVCGEIPEIHKVTAISADIPRCHIYCKNGCCSVSSSSMDVNACISMWNNVINHLRWSNESPTVEGYYFHRYNFYDDKPKIVHVFENKDNNCLCCCAIESRDIKLCVDFVNGEWAGPIQMPCY